MSLSPVVLALAPSPSSADGGTFWGSRAGELMLRFIAQNSAVGDYLPDYIEAWHSAVADARTLSRRAFDGSGSSVRCYQVTSGRHVIALGKPVCELVYRIKPRFGEIFVCQHPTGGGFSIVLPFPHPSPRNRFWGEADSVPRAVAWMRAFYDDWRAAEASERTRKGA